MILETGSQGDSVKALQSALLSAGFPPGALDGDFGPATEAAVIAFQKSENLPEDGEAGQLTQQALHLTSPNSSNNEVTSLVTLAMASKIFPFTHLSTLQANLAEVLKALSSVKLGDKDMLCMAFGTIAAECGSFVPLVEAISRFNTSPGGHAFDLYDNRKDLGNRGAPDGAKYCGRGYVQLTGRRNYNTYAPFITTIDLLDNPQEANDNDIAATLLAQFLKNSEMTIRSAILQNNLALARKLVNGGENGLDAFANAFVTTSRLLNNATAIPISQPGTISVKAPPWRRPQSDNASLSVKDSGAYLPNNSLGTTTL